MKKENKILSTENEVWLFCFSFVNLCVFVAFYLLIYPNINFSKSQYNKNDLEKKDNQIIRAFIENPKEEIQQNNQKNVQFLGKKNQAGMGKLTTKDGFRSENSERFLKLTPKQQNTQNIPRPQETPQDAFTIEKIIKDFGIKKQVSKKRKKEKKKNSIASAKQIPFDGSNAIEKMPFYLQNKREFVFSYNPFNGLRIPTVAFEQYDYFTKMFDKFKENWAIPGYGVSGTYRYNRGRLKIQLYPEHKIYFTFALDKKGDVVFAEIYKSMNYEVLDNSIIQALYKAKNFSPPPKKILKNGHLIVPVVIYIY